MCIVSTYVVNHHGVQELFDGGLDLIPHGQTDANYAKLLAGELHLPMLEDHKLVRDVDMPIAALPPPPLALPPDVFAGEGVLPEEEYAEGDHGEGEVAEEHVAGADAAEAAARDAEIVNTILADKKWGVFSWTVKADGSIQCTCPFHKKSRWTGCKRTVKPESDS